MRINFKNFLCIFTGLAAFLGASNADTMFSKYGIIQNVQNYSSNPFWNPNSPYNNRMPQPVYATGPQVKTDECQRIVTSLVTLQCMNANNCIGVELGDIRPAIILQLSRMSGGNYATACAGYLDGIFNDYVSQFANAAPNGTPSKFPTPVAPNTNANGNQIQQLSNPFATPAPDWATDMRERQLELQALHTETDTNNHQIQSAEFPTTYADVSFTDRLENARNGYEPFKDAHAYREMDIEDEETYLERVERIKKLKKKEDEEKDQKQQYYPQGKKKSNQGHNPQAEALLSQEGEKPQQEVPDITPPENNEGQTQQEETRQEGQGNNRGQGTFSIPRIEQEDSTVPPISLEGKNPDSNLCSFASDGANALYANTPSKLEHVTNVINTNPNGKILLEAAAYAGCATQTGIAGGTYCWCAFDGRKCKKPQEEGCDENELEEDFLLICADLARSPMFPATAAQCPEQCAKKCKEDLIPSPQQNQQ